MIVRQAIGTRAFSQKMTAPRGAKENEIRTYLSRFGRGDLDSALFSSILDCATDVSPKNLAPRGAVKN
jgi:hypothetical protein